MLKTEKDVKIDRQHTLIYTGKPCLAACSKKDGGMLASLAHVMVATSIDRVTQAPTTPKTYSNKHVLVGMRRQQGSVPGLS